MEGISIAVFLLCMLTPIEQRQQSHILKMHVHICPYVCRSGKYVPLIEQQEVIIFMYVNSVSALRI